MAKSLTRGLVSSSECFIPAMELLENLIPSPAAISNLRRRALMTLRISSKENGAKKIFEEASKRV